MSDELLIEAAMAARANCYCPYSSFPVSAALLAESGKIYTGVNVENASYGLTICAERVAVGSAIAAGERKFEKLVVVVRGGGSPCGACRQVLNEFAPELPVLMVDELGRISSETTLAELLPRAFGPQSL
ncbi:MAG: cytidine deaminase [Akkermansiaceae bacterium]|jgi:cytidine deaminase|nr:cytidine deaminase [Akkermansiaceae bacterium]